MSASHTTGNGHYLMTIGHLVSILRARWRAVALTTMVCLALGLAISLLLPRQYTATATVLVDVKSPDPLNGMMMQGMMAPSYMTTQIDLINSDTVARRAARAMNLHQSPPLLEQWRSATDGRGDLDTWLGERLLKRLDVRPSKDSNVLQVGYTASDAGFAANAANAFVKAYIETTLDLRTEPAKQYKRFFNDNAKQLRENLEIAQKRLSDFQQKHGLIGNEDQSDMEATRLNEMSQQLVMLQAQASDTRNRASQAGQSADQLQENLNNPLILGLREELQSQRAKIRELRASMGERHPQIVQLKERIEETKSRIDEETRRVAGGVSVNNTVNQRRLADLKASIDEQRAKVMKLKAVRDEAIVFRRDVESAQRAYDAVLNRANQMSLESQAATTNVSVVGMATPPITPSSPNMGRNLAGALILGLFAGLATAMIREFRDQRLRTEEEAVAVLGQPVVVVLPAFGGRSTTSRWLPQPNPTRPARRLTSS